MALEKGVMLLSFYASPYGQRAQIALAEKGVQYECKEENLPEKSELLLKSNLVYKKIPVLIHNGKPISESLVIVEYIDEVWSDKVPLVPSDPYQRAQARLWAGFADKVYECGGRLWNLKGEEQEGPKKEIIEILKLLETQLGDNKYFGGDTFGFVDVAFIPFTSWFYSYETYANFSIEGSVPKIVQWAMGQTVHGAGKCGKDYF
ncbi:Tau glutathione S-transferase [Rhynchospora pubera]|uniref:glutathione transferase n=1 Tax=Rhynchospora pubera TaxID=906938 RepID=A0AAV8G9K9_9POAL|nr:Tau glutathione S-transferase [Rhynchospora pubera]